MRACAFQFPVTGNVEQNFFRIERAVCRAAEEKAEMLVLPECALTGYPPADLFSAGSADPREVKDALCRLSALCERTGLTVIAGTVLPEKGCCSNAAVTLFPDGRRSFYRKRALWGWDADNFAPGTDDGIIRVNDFCIGIRICFEVRFPEYFRELYRAGTDLNVILFYDRSAKEDPSRYGLIRSHILTRAVENVTETLTVNTCGSYQTAPTLFCDRSGRVIREAAPGKEEFVILNTEKRQDGFGEKGRRSFSDLLCGKYGRKEE